MSSLCSALFLVEQRLKSSELPAHVRVDLQVAGHDHFHLLHIVIDVTIFRVLTLNILDQLALLRDHMGDFFKVL